MLTLKLNVMCNNGMMAILKQSGHAYRRAECSQTDLRHLSSF